MNVSVSLSDGMPSSTTVTLTWKVPESVNPGVNSSEPVPSPLSSNAPNDSDVALVLNTSVSVHLDQLQIV